MPILELFLVAAIVCGALFIVLGRAKRATRALNLKPGDPESCPGTCAGCSQLESLEQLDCSGKNDGPTSLTRIEK